MFEFLNPLFLWAAGAAGIPLFLHLMRQRRVVRVPFSTLRFLKLAERRTSRRIRLEQFLLWFLRTALMLAIAAAFAMPMLRTRGFAGFSARAQRDVAIVLDASYSMYYQCGRFTAWENAVEIATALVEELKEGDRVCLFLATDDVRPLVEKLTSDRQMVTGQLKNLKPEYTSSRLEPALRAAYRTLQDQSGRREREIHVLTDGQNLPWTGMLRAEKGAKGWSLTEEADNRTACYITLTGAQNPVNLSPASVELHPLMITAHSSARVDARLIGSGSAGDSSAILMIDGAQVARRTLTAAERDKAATVVFTLPPLSPGLHGAAVTLPPDSLPADDAFHFMIDVKEKIPVLCVGAPDETLYVMRALQAGATGGASPLRAKQVAGTAVTEEDLRSCVSVILCNALPLPGPTVLQLERYVQDGGVLVLFPGAGAQAGDYASLTCLPVAGAPQDLPTEQRKRSLRWNTPQHPLFDAIRDIGDAAPVCAIARYLPWTLDNATMTVLITAGDGMPFLVEKKVGSGRVLAFTVSADRAWSTFPLSPFFLPVLHQIARYGAGVTGTPLFHWTGRNVTLPEDTFPANDAVVLTAPDGSPVPIRRMPAHEKAAYVVDNLGQPGIYRRPATSGGAELPVLAANAERTESDLTPVDRDRLPDVTGADRTQVADNKDDLLRLVRASRVGLTLAEHALWLVLLLAAAEVFMANRLARAGSALSETLKIELTGRVRKPAENA